MDLSAPIQPVDPNDLKLAWHLYSDVKSRIPADEQGAIGIDVRLFADIGAKSDPGDLSRATALAFRVSLIALLIELGCQQQPSQTLFDAAATYDLPRGLIRFNPRDFSEWLPPEEPI